MRYITESKVTHQHLEAWSGNAELRVAAFFFWNSGTVEQRSLAGLLRSLLSEILRGDTDLIRIAFESEWTDARDLLFAGQNALNITWSYRNLENSLKRLTKAASEKLKICFFIDG